MPYYAERLRRKQIEDGESQGESFWTDELDDVARNKLRASTVRILDILSDEDRFSVRKVVTNRICENLGLPEGSWSSTFGSVTTYRPEDGIVEGDTSVALSIVEAVAELARIPDIEGSDALAASYWADVNEVLRSHRVSVAIVDGAFVPLDSEVLHVEIVESALRLLRQVNGWENVEAAYREALDELHRGKFDNAVTDAKRAVEVALDVVGASGSSLSKKMKYLVGKKQLPPYDKHMANWLEAERYASGDVHDASDAGSSDAWLAVYIAGAWIRRLSELDDLPRVASD